MTKYFFLIGLFICLFACDKELSNNFSQQAPAEIITIPIAETASDLSSIFQFDQFIALDSTISIGSISKVLVQGDRILVGDYKNTKDIYCFDKKGQLLWQANLNKLSPGYSINDFLIDSTTRNVLISKGEFMYVFDSNGQLIATKPVRIGQHEYVHKLSSLGPHLYCALYKAGDTRLPYKLGLFNKSLEQVSNTLSRDAVSGPIIRSISNLNQGVKAHSCLYSEYFNDTLYSIETNGLRPEYLLDNRTGISKHPEIRDMDFDAISALAKTNKLAIGPDIVFETEHWLHLAVLQNEVYSSIYFNKNSHKSWRINNDSDNLFGGSFGHIPYAVLPNDQYVFVVEPFLLHKLEKASLEQYHPLVKTMYSQSSWNSNPILLIGTLKPQNNLSL